jgi:hypothetical protein
VVKAISVTLRLQFTEWIRQLPITAPSSVAGPRVPVDTSASFFAGLSQVERIFVMGHSISTVDHPYLREVIRNIDADRVKWKISYFGDLASLRKRMEELAIAPELIEYALLADF